MAIVAAAIGACARWYLGPIGVASGPAAWTLWAWIALTLLAAAALVVGWVGISGGDEAYPRWPPRCVCCASH
jgi:hypothetical protein